MLNLRDSKLKSILTSLLTASEAREQVTTHWQNAQKSFKSSPLVNSQAAETSLLASYTDLLGDKLYQALTEVSGVSSDFLDRIWIESAANTPEQSGLKFNLETKTGTLGLFSVMNPLSDDGHLVSENLPTLLQITAKDAELVFTQAELDQLSTIIKVLYTADYRFLSIDDTVLQPIDQLSFKTKYDNTQPLTTTVHVDEPGNVQLSMDIDPNAVVVGYQILDDAGHDWMDLGTEDLTKTTFSWASTTIPDELVDHNLTLQLNLRSSNNSPALDELFVTASNNAILMRQLPGNGHYELVLPNKQPLTVQVDPKSDTLKLGYPENTIQIIELNKQYPFIGDWLKQVLPKKPAFN